jgi:hypothetical protein
MKHFYTLLFFLSFCIHLAGQAVSFPEVSIQSSNDPVIAGELPQQETAMTEGNGLQDLELKVFPNPATDFIRVEWQTNRLLEMHVELYDLFGRRLSLEKTDDSGNHIQIDIQSLQRSAYLLKVFTSDGQFSKTFRVVKY